MAPKMGYNDDMYDSPQDIPPSQLLRGALTLSWDTIEVGYILNYQMTASISLH